MGDVSALGFQIIEDSGAYATKYSFFETLTQHNPDVIIAGAHGDPKTLTGQALEEVLKSCQNNEVLSGRVMCAISCLTGQNLGPDSREKTAEAYIGFVNEFSWIVDTQYPPGSDPSAYSFQQIVRKIISLSCQYQQESIGLKDIYDGVIAEFEAWEDYYSVPPGSDDPDAGDILICLRHDKTGLITIGEEGRYYYPSLGLPIMPLATLSVGALVVLAPFFI